MILNIKGNEYEVNAMTKSGPNFWKWPTTKDKIWYNEDKIVALLSLPTIENAREIYSFPELSK